MTNPQEILQRRYDELQERKSTSSYPAVLQFRQDEVLMIAHRFGVKIDQAEKIRPSQK